MLEGGVSIKELENAMVALSNSIKQTMFIFEYSKLEEPTYIKNKPEPYYKRLNPNPEAKHKK